VSAQGRLFAIVDEAPAGMDGSAPDKWSLVARDAFNGLLLWKKPIPEWGWKTWSGEWTCRFTVPTHLPRRLVAVGDRVYVTLGFNAPLSELDAATGQVLRVFEGTEFTDEILCHDGRLILALNKRPQRPGTAAGQRRDGDDDPPVRKCVAAVDVQSGQLAWKTGDYVGLRSKTGSMDRVSHLSACAGDRRVFFVDRDRIVSLDLKSGRRVWQVARPEVPENKMRYDIRITDMCTLVYHDGSLYFAQLNPDRFIDWREIRGRLHVFSADTGEESWSRECASWGWGHPADVFVIGGLVWVHGFQNGPRNPKECRPKSAADLASGSSWVGSESSFVLGLDPATGDVKRKISSFEAFNNGHHHRCYRNKATPRFLMTSFRGLEFLPWNGDGTQQHHWVRGTCRLGAIPCNGLVYSNPHPCDCYITSKLNGFLALAPGDEWTKGGADPPNPEAPDRLERGAAYDRGPQEPSSGADHPDDWPTYRHDCQRSGTTRSPLPAALRRTWEADVGTRPSACVGVGDTVFLAAVDARQVLALSAVDGRRLWKVTVGGRVDTPPTISNGRVYFGSADGHVYCVRSADGQLVWRFRGAPRNRLVGAFGAVESAWPVHGSVLADDDTVYFTAGRSSFLDGGICAFALDARTGAVRSERKIATPHQRKVAWGRDPSIDTGQLSDVLVGHGESVYMRRCRLFPAEDDRGAGSPLFATAGLLDSTWFSRTRWHVDGKPVAEYCVFNADTVYGVAERRGMSANGGFFNPAAGGYELFAIDRPSAAAGSGGGPARPSGKKKPSSGRRWSARVPVRVTSLVLAGSTLFAAGTPDLLDKTDPWAAFEGRRGGRLLAVSAQNGKILEEYDLHAPPVLDGLAASRGRLLVSTTDGKVFGYEGEQP
ncbi:MAG: outer membrane protein assembly factor BamB family protein, partial [Planctomycetota bacterium]